MIGRMVSRSTGLQRRRIGREAAMEAMFEEIEGVDAVAVSFPRGAEPDEISTTVAELAP
jgi:hypothetical protein